ncbi:MAG: hypothetical protein AAB263_08015, partial [Planctomycetota bacterium]
NGKNTELITIAGEPGATPQIERLMVDGDKWLILGLSISASFAKEPYKGNMAIIGEHSASSEITLQDCFIYSALNHDGWTAKQWMEANSGILMGRNGKNLTVRNTYVLNTRFGIAMCSPDSLVEGSVVSDYSGDALRMTRDGETVRCNVFKNAYVSDKDGDPNHDDLVQGFLFNKGTGTIRNFTVKDNILIGNEDPKQPFAHVPQGIGMFDGPLINFIITGNVIHTAHWHGISLYDAQGCTINDNVCFTKTTTGPMPWIMFGSKLKKVGNGNVVKNNYAHTYNLKLAKGATLENNEPVNEDIYRERLKKLREQIDIEFGRYHPVAGFARLGTEKGVNQSAPAPEKAP